MDVSAEFRRCLIELDVEGSKKLWAYLAPHLPQPENDDAALYTLHLARTKAKSVPLRHRLYSQAWLEERSRSERRAIAHAVGVAVGFPGVPLRPRQEDVRDAMSESALDSYNAGIDLDVDAAEVRARMLKARGKIHGLTGAVSGHRV